MAARWWLMHFRSRGPKSIRRGKTRAWRAEQRRRAEAEHARRKQAREANQISQPREMAADAETRYTDRQLRFAVHHGRRGRTLHALAWLLHNCVAHPLLGLLPCRASVWLHDRSADWLNLSPVRTRSALPRITSYRAWLVHNCIAHPMMGLAPLRAAFTAHDRSAEHMDVEGWL